MDLFSRYQRLLSSLGISGALVTIAVPAAPAESLSPNGAPDPTPASTATAGSGSESTEIPAPSAREGAKPAPTGAAKGPPTAPKGSPVAPLRVIAGPGEEPFRAGLQWNERWRRVTLLEHTTTAVFGAGAYLANEIPARKTGRWENGFDEGIRDALRAESRSARRGMAIASDIFFYGLMAYPVLVDTLFVAGLRNSDVAWQMMVMNLNSLAFSGMLSVLLERVSGRERPFVRECAADPSYDPDCGGDGLKTNVSFPSGHTMMASTGAGLICAHHLNLPLYGGGAPDSLACATAVGLAGLQGLFRITADRHYATDVIAFGLVGFGSGFLLPTLLHYTEGKGASPRVSVTPYANDTGGGLIASGTL